jgi:hypothetical protein
MELDVGSEFALKVFRFVCMRLRAKLRMEGAA